jgi:RNA polymerase sigma factor (sigma-70 family)
MNDTAQPPDDHDLLAAFAAGDQEAFARLVSRHQGLVAAACRRQASATETDDCVQAVFLILARKPQAAAGVPSLAAWLLRVAAYVCRHSRRAAQRRTRAERTTPATEGHQPETAVLEHLDHCLDRLNERQRNAVVLHYYQGLDASEIAGRLGISRNQVYLLLHRGLAALRTALARRGVAVGAAALAAVFAGQAQAAISSARGVTIVLGRMASKRSQSLAAAAQHDLAIAHAMPWAAAAGIALVLGVIAVFATSHATAARKPLTPAAPPVATTPTPTPPAGPAPTAAIPAPTNLATAPAPSLPSAAERAAVPALAAPLRVLVRGGDRVRTLAMIAQASGLTIRVLGDGRPLDLGDEPAPGKAPAGKPIGAWFDAIATATGQPWRIVGGGIEVGVGAERAKLAPTADPGPLVSLAVKDMASNHALDFLKNLQQVRLSTISGRIGPVSIDATEAPTPMVMAQVALQIGGYAVNAPEGWTLTPLAGIAQ